MSTVVVVVLLIGAAVGAARLIAGAPEVDGYLSSREADAAHLVMNLGMAWMASPWFGPGGRTVLVVVFAVLALGFVARLVLGRIRPSPERRSRCGAEVYHLVASAAMVLATVLMPAEHGGMGDTDGMGDMSGMADMTADPAPGPPLIAVLLAVGFGIDALITLAVAALAPDRVAAESARRAGRTGGDPSTVLVAGPSTRRTVRVAAVPHVIMGAGMTWMLLML